MGSIHTDSKQDHDAVTSLQRREQDIPPFKTIFQGDQIYKNTSAWANNVAGPFGLGLVTVNFVVLKE